MGLGEEEGRGFEAVVRTARPELEIQFVGSEAPRKTDESQRPFGNRRGRRDIGRFTHNVKPAL